MRFKTKQYQKYYKSFPRYSTLDISSIFLDNRYFLDILKCIIIFCWPTIMQHC